MLGRTGPRVLITGGNGFMGSNLARRLLGEDADLFVTVSPGSELWRLKDIADKLKIRWLDVTDLEAVRQTLSEVAPDIVFHTAMRHGHPRTAEEKQLTLLVSAVGTFALLEACSQVGVARLIHLGGSTEYCPSLRAMGEKLPLEPNSFRGMAKMLASQIVSYYARVHELPVVVIRPFTVYGPWEAFDRFIPRLLVKALNDEEIALAGPGLRHDYVFVADVVEALVRSSVANLCPGQSINIGSGQEYTNEEVAELVSKLVGRPLRVRLGSYPPSPTDRPHWKADITLARRLIGFRPQYPLREGLRVHLEWLRCYLGL